MDRQLAELAEKQHGVVTRAQLLALGFTKAAVDSRVRRGALRLVHRGVYAVGHTALRDEGWWLAAVLACGPGAVLSHLSAAAFWAMRVPRHAEIHVTAKRLSGPLGVVVHETRHLSGADITVERFVPVTTRARTVIDCADLMAWPELRALADHGVRMDVDALRRAQLRAPGRRGARNITRLIASDPRTRSELERAMRKICRRLGAPQPEINGKVLGIERDFVWRAQRLVVETDGGTFHLPKAARERDYEDDVRLVVAGWRVVRFSYDQVLYEPDAVAARLAQLLIPTSSAS